jgi:serine protease Do
LAKAEAWGNFLGTGPYLGVRGADDAEVAKIATVLAGTPAEKAGLKPGDVVLQYSGQEVKDFASLQLRVNDSMPGDKVTVVVLRGETKLELVVTIGQRANDD